MKIVLAAVNAKYIHSNLAVRYLKEYTRDLDYVCTIREFSINDRIERVVEEIMLEKPDVIGFSCYIWNIDFIIHIAHLIKKINIEIEIFYGGPEVSYDCEKFLSEKPGDFLMEGEGEETYREFIQYKIGLLEIQDIKGLYHKKQDASGNSHTIEYGGSRPLMDMNKLIFPYTEEETGSKIIYYEASRGCPFSCKYCLSSTIHGVRFLDVERVKRELQFFMDKSVRLVKFVDRTFNCNRKFAREIWNFLINAETDTSFHFEISADILTQEDIELLKSAPKGRIQFEIGVQTTNEETLENINRRIKFEDIREKVKQLGKGRNIKQHLDLIAGLPGEDFRSFRNSFNDVYALAPEEIQLGFLKLLKGSAMRQEAEKWGIVYSPYQPYEILKSKDISYEQLVILKRVEEMVDKYYNSGKFNSILKFFIGNSDDPFSFYLDLGMFFYEKGYLNRNISNADYYKVFLEFYEAGMKEESLELAEIIKFDYLKFNKKKWIPDFLWRDAEKIDDNYSKRILASKGFVDNYNKIHIEKFRINIFKFLEDNTVQIEDRFYLFDLENADKIIDVTDI